MKIKAFAAVLLTGAALTLTGCGDSEARDAYSAGAEALEAGDTALAIEMFEKTVSAGKYLSEAYRGIGIAKLGEANYPDACIAFEKSLLYVEGESEEYQRDVSIYLAYSRERQGQNDKAMEIYDRLIKKEPDAETLYLRGRLNLRSGVLKAAKSDFEQAILMNSDYDLYINIYKIYEDEEKSGDGSYYLEKALSAANSNEDDYYNQGLVNYYLQNYEEARDLLIKAVKQDGQDGRSVFLLGSIYLAMNDIADARAIFREYVDDEQTAASAYNGLVLCDLSDGNYDSALQNVEKGLAMGESDAEQALRFNEIVVLEKKMQWSSARSKAASYIAKYPTDEAGLREYDFLVTR